MRSILALAALIAVLPLAAAAQAPRTIEDCERIKADLAYNQCLASFGPKVGERSARSYAPAEDIEEDQPAVRRSGRRVRATIRTGRRGRQAATFEIISNTPRLERRVERSRSERPRARRSRRR
jgi:hypothetical protein